MVSACKRAATATIDRGFYQEEYKILAQFLQHAVKVLPRSAYVMPLCKLVIYNTSEIGVGKQGNYCFANHTLHREEGCGHTATIELLPCQKLAVTNQIVDRICCRGVNITSCVQQMSASIYYI